MQAGARGLGKHDRGRVDAADHLDDAAERLAEACIVQELPSPGPGLRVEG